MLWSINSKWIPDVINLPENILGGCVAVCCGQTLIYCKACNPLFTSHITRILIKILHVTCLSRQNIEFQMGALCARTICTRSSMWFHYFRVQSICKCCLDCGVVVIIGRPYFSPFDIRAKWKDEIYRLALIKSKRSDCHFQQYSMLFHGNLCYFFYLKGKRNSKLDLNNGIPRIVCDVHLQELSNKL